MLVPIATTTKPIVNLSTFKIHPTRPTSVTMPKLKMAIHTIEAKNETRKYFLLCASEQLGIVQVNIHRNGKETTKRNQSIRYRMYTQLPSPFSGKLAATAGRHGMTRIFLFSSCCSLDVAINIKSKIVHRYYYMPILLRFLYDSNT